MIVTYTDRLNRMDTVKRTGTDTWYYNKWFSGISGVT